MEALLVAQIGRHSRDHVSVTHPDGRKLEGLVRSVTASEIALALNLPERSVAGLVDESALLTEVHGPTLEALSSGEISRRHALLIVHESLGIPPGTVPEFERELLGLARASLRQSWPGAPGGSGRSTTRKGCPPARARRSQTGTLNCGPTTTAWRGSMPTFRRNRRAESTSGSPYRHGSCRRRTRVGRSPSSAQMSL